MVLDLSTALDAARSPSPWDFGNGVLYDLCAEHPLHNESQVVLAKIWLIGRSYAAAIERRLEKNDPNDDFYTQHVAPAIIASEIDSWIAEAGEFGVICPKAFDTVLAVHASVTNLFNRISGLGKRSLASKYLHFHLPTLFYIYDSRAVESMRFLAPIVGRVKTSKAPVDVEYAKFAAKCLRFQMYVHEEFGVNLTPRQIDNFLLHVHAAQNSASLT